MSEDVREEDARENEEVREPDGEEHEEEQESEGGGKIGLIIIGLLVVAILAAAYLNQRFYGDREPRRAADFEEADDDPWPRADDPGMPRRQPVAPDMDMAEEYRAFLNHYRMMTGEYVYSADDQLYIIASFPRQGIDRDGAPFLSPGGLFNVSNTAEGVSVRSLHRRLIGPEQILPSNAFPPLGLRPETPAPRLAPATELNLPANDRIVSVTVNGETRAYPVRFLNYHEVVNDEIGGVPVVIAWSALADAAFALDRRLDDETALRFGSAGLLYRGVGVIYDTETRSLWSPFNGKCLAGEKTGERLNNFQVARTNWAYWSGRHAQSLALAGAEPPFEDIDYSENPQIPTDSYYYDELIPYPVEGFDIAGSPISPKTQIAGAAVNDSAAAYPMALLRERGEISDTVGERRITARYVSDGGYAEFFDADGEPLLSYRMFWMIWQGNHPGTRLYGDHDDSPETLETPMTPDVDQFPALP